MAMSAASLTGASGLEVMAAVRMPCSPAVLQCTDDVGRGARCGDAYDGVEGADVVGLQVAPALLGVVLGVLHGVAQRGVAAGDDADDPGGVHAECGRYL